MVNRQLTFGFDLDCLHLGLLFNTSLSIFFIKIIKLKKEKKEKKK
jgi:hypothetical protein